MKKAETIVFGGLVLLAAALQFLVFGYIDPWSALVTLAFLLMGIVLFAALLRTAAARVGAWVWIISGLVILGGLFVPPALMIDYLLEDRLPGLAATLVTILLFGLLLLAPVSAALLLASGLKYFSSRPAEPGKRPSGRAAAAALVLCALLAAKYLHNLYWLGVWDRTYDPLEILWLLVPNLGILAGAGLLAALLAGRWKLAGPLFGLVFPALALLVFSQAQQVDFHQLTAERAAQVGQALEAYAAGEGRYPASLAQLAPRYLLAVPGPVVLNGQDWCYQGGQGYYRLGYVDRLHWSDPNWFGHLALAQGSPPPGPDLCAAELKQ